MLTCFGLRRSRIANTSRCNLLCHLVTYRPRYITSSLLGQRELLFSLYSSLSNVRQTVTLHNASAPSPKESLRNTYPHTAPILDVAFSGKADQGAKCYTGGLDRQVREIDLASGQQTILGSHTEAVRCVNWSEETSGSSPRRLGFF